MCSRPSPQLWRSVIVCPSGEQMSNTLLRLQWITSWIDSNACIQNSTYSPRSHGSGPLIRSLCGLERVHITFELTTGYTGATRCHRTFAHQRKSPAALGAEGTSSVPGQTQAAADFHIDSIKTLLLIREKLPSGIQHFKVITGKQPFVSNNPSSPYYYNLDNRKYPSCKADADTKGGLDFYSNREEIT